MVNQNTYIYYLYFTVYQQFFLSSLQAVYRRYTVQYAGSILAVYMEYTGSILSVYRQYIGSYRQYTGSIYVVYRQYIGSIQVVYRQYTGSIQAVYREYTGSIQVVYMQYTGSIQVVYRQYICSIQVVYRQYTDSIQAVYREYTGSYSQYTGCILRLILANLVEANQGTPAKKCKSQISIFLNAQRSAISDDIFIKKTHFSNMTPNRKQKKILKNFFVPPPKAPR